MTSLAARDSSLAQIIHFARPSVMAEFGSWEGASAITFLRAASEAKLELTLICVDTWLGSPEHWENAFPNSQWSFERLGVVEGEPTVIETFRRAVEAQGMTRRVKIVRAPTTHAAGYISRTFQKLDLLFLDADHSFRAVRCDLKLAFRLVSNSGLVAGDDWGWLSVRLAVATRSIFTRKIYSSPDGSTYVLIRHGSENVESKFGESNWKRESAAISLIWVPFLQLFRLLRKQSQIKIDRLYSRIWNRN